MLAMLNVLVSILHQNRDFTGKCSILGRLDFRDTSLAHFSDSADHFSSRMYLISSKSLGIF